MWGNSCGTVGDRPPADSSARLAVRLKGIRFYRRGFCSTCLCVIIWDNNQPIAFALTSASDEFLMINSLLLRHGTDIAEAVAAVAAEKETAYARQNHPTS